VLVSRAGKEEKYSVIVSRVGIEKGNTVQIYIPYVSFRVFGRGLGNPRDGS
jgi:hypothetical protein